MPLFGKRPAQPSDEERRAAEIDLERIRQGGIPLGAEERLRQLREEPRPPFSSDLSAKEYALAAASGLQPIAQVMGSSVIQQGWQSAGYGGGGMFGAGGMFGGMQGGLHEIPALAEPWNLCRDRAFERLRLEAQAAGADAVIGIEMRAQPFMGEPSQLELAVFGTAVRETTLNAGRPRDAAQPAGGPRMSTLSGQDVDKLRRIGAETLGVIGHTIVLLTTLGFQSAQSLMTWGGNQELREVSFAVSAARARAMDEVRSQGQAIGANDMVVSTLRHTIEHHEVEGGGYRSHYFVVTMNVLATAIRLGAHEPHPAPFTGPVMSISLGA